MSNKQQVFEDKKDNEKWGKLVNFYNSINDDKYKNTNKKILSRIGKKQAGELFPILVTLFLQSGNNNWTTLRKEINNLDNNITPAPGFFAKLFGPNDDDDDNTKKEAPKASTQQNSSPNDKVAKPFDDDLQGYVEMHINIGKDKKVFPNHLVRFICESMKIDRDNIKHIRIFDKYAFFKIPQELGDKAIILLSVKRFRGKKISVNFSKKKSK